MRIAGFGFRSDASLASLQIVLATAMEDGGPVTALATLGHKTDLPERLAETLALPLIPVSADRLAGLATLTVSPASLAAYRTGSVAEAVALAAAGLGARLLGPRHISPDRRATCALAECLEGFSA